MLTSKQVKKIKELSAQGISNNKISKQMKISRTTVDNYVKKYKKEILQGKAEAEKLCAYDVAEVALIALNRLRDALNDTAKEWNITQLSTTFGILADKAERIEELENREETENNSGNIIIAPIKPLEGAENETA